MLSVTHTVLLCCGCSYSLEGLAGEEDAGKASVDVGSPGRVTRLDSEERGSLLSLTEEQESDLGDCSSLDSQVCVQAYLYHRGPVSCLRKDLRNCRIFATSRVEWLSVCTVVE